jgi:copper transport protein
MADMTVDTPRWRRAGPAVAGLLLGLLSVLLAPATPASAHAVLQTTDPPTNAVLPEAPPRVTLTFSESVQLVPGRTQVLGPDGRRVDEGEPTVAGNTVTIALRPAAAQGTYLVSFRVISADSHPVAGGLTYSVGSRSAAPAGAAEPQDLVDPVVRVAIPVVRYLGYTGLLLAVGPILVLSLLWPHRLSRQGPARLVWTGLGLVAGSTLASIWLQAPYATGTGLAQVGLGDLRDVLGSTFGAVMLVRLGVLCAAVALLRPLLRGDGGDSRTDLAVLGVLAVAGLATWPLTGHPAASPVAAVSVVLDAVHLAAMAVWLGGLVMLFAFLLPRAEPRELGAILPIWSRWAAAAVAALVLAGTVQALVEVGSVGGLTGTTYGRLILAKVALVGLVLVVAWFARRLVQRRAGADDGPGPVRRLIAVELAVTAAVLGITAVLVQVTPARTAVAAATAPTDTTVRATLTAEKLSLQVDVTPGQVGNNSVHLYAYTRDGAPLPVVQWTGTAALPALGVEPVDIPLLQITDNHAIGDTALAAPGDWVLRFTVRTSQIDQSTVSMTVRVR